MVTVPRASDVVEIPADRTGPCGTEVVLLAASRPSENQELPEVSTLGLPRQGPVKGLHGNTHPQSLSLFFASVQVESECSRLHADQPLHVHSKVTVLDLPAPGADPQAVPKADPQRESLTLHQVTGLTPQQDAP